MKRKRGGTAPFISQFNKIKTFSHLIIYLYKFNTLDKATTVGIIIVIKSFIPLHMINTKMLYTTIIHPINFAEFLSLSGILAFSFLIFIICTVIKIHDIPQKISSTSSRTDIIHFPLFHLLQLFRL